MIQYAFLNFLILIFFFTQNYAIFIFLLIINISLFRDNVTVWHIVVSYFIAYCFTYINELFFYLYVKFDFLLLNIDIFNPIVFILTTINLIILFFLRYNEKKLIG